MLCLNFDSNYIKSMVPNWETSFPPSQNQLDAVVCWIAGTTNVVEGWHFVIQSYFSGADPKKLQIVGSLQKDTSEQKVEIFYASSSHKMTKRKKYRLLNERVQNIMSIYKKKLFCTFSEWYIVCLRPV